MPVEPATESVAHPLLEVLLVAHGEHPPLHPAQARPCRFHQPEIAQRVSDPEWIIEETASIVDAARPGNVDEIVPHEVFPERLDLWHLREEAMAADVESVSPMGFGPGDAAHPVTGLEHQRNPACVETLKMKRSSETGRTSADHQRVDRFVRASINDHFSAPLQVAARFPGDQTCCRRRILVHRLELAHSCDASAMGPVREANAGVSFTNVGFANA